MCSSNSPVRIRASWPLASRRRMGGGEDWEHEDVAVPEDVTAVRGPREPPGADGSLAAVGDRADQMEKVEADRALELGIALDDDVRLLPASAPRLPLLAQEPFVSRLFGLGQSDVRQTFIEVERAEPLE